MTLTAPTLTPSPSSRKTCTSINAAWEDWAETTPGTSEAEKALAVMLQCAQKEIFPWVRRGIPTHTQKWIELQNDLKTAVWRAAEKYNPKHMSKSSFKTYAQACCENETLGFLRKTHAIASKEVPYENPRGTKKACHRQEITYWTDRSEMESAERWERAMSSLSCLKDEDIDIVLSSVENSTAMKRECYEKQNGGEGYEAFKKRLQRSKHEIAESLRETELFAEIYGSDLVDA